METHSTAFKTRLGLFVAAGLALFVIAIFYIGRQKHLFSPVIKVSSLFRNIGGVEIGNNVRFSGINVGTVENIMIENDTTVRVDIIIDKDVHQFIKKDCFVTIGSEGIIGDKIINITQGSPDAEIINDGEFLRSVEPVQTDAIIASLKVTAENAEVVSDQLAQILYKVNNGNGTFGMLLNDSTMADNLTRTIYNLRSSAKGLDENMEAAKHNILLRGYFKKKKEEEEKNGKGKRTDKKSEVKADSGLKEGEGEKKGLFNKLFNKKSKPVANDSKKTIPPK